MPTSGLPTGRQSWGRQFWVHQSSGLPTELWKLILTCFEPYMANITDSALGLWNGLRGELSKDSQPYPDWALMPHLKYFLLFFPARYSVILGDPRQFCTATHSTWPHRRWCHFYSHGFRLMKRLPPATFWAPIYYVLMPWRTLEVNEKAYELIDEASTFPWPAQLDVMMDFEL